MLFFRIENDEKIGVYNGQGREVMELWAEADGRETLACCAHPCPWDDSLINLFLSNTGGGIWGEYFFGFTSIEQMRRWFYNDDILALLDQSGYHLSVYEFPSIVSGHTQAMASMEYKGMVPIEKKKLTEV